MSAFFSVPLACSLVWVLAVSLLDPTPLYAWGPATHIALGEGVLGALYLLPPMLRSLLERYPMQFLYGSIAADISFAKKYAEAGRHCHHWHVGEEILDAAGDDPLRAVAFGYLAHLAADTVAHNVYVPRQLLLTSTSKGLGHTYWEHRMDMHAGEAYLAEARRLITEHDHRAADELFDQVLSATLFSFQTNRRIFRGMIRVQGTERWQRVFDTVLKNSRFDLPDPLVRRYLEISFDSVIDYLVNRHRSAPATLDPIGEVNLRLAKQIRHRELADGAIDDPDLLARSADAFFPIPDAPLTFRAPQGVGTRGRLKPA
ncbi:MAG: zinc dependent phospholipase C family protein [Gemmatimonadota bacterium]